MIPLFLALIPLLFVLIPLFLALIPPFPVMILHIHDSCLASFQKRPLSSIENTYWLSSSQSATANMIRFLSPTAFMVFAQRKSTCQDSGKQLNTQTATEGLKKKKQWRF